MKLILTTILLLVSTFCFSQSIVIGSNGFSSNGVVSIIENTYSGRVQCTGTVEQTIPETNVQANSVITLTYENAIDTTIQPIQLGSRIAGVSFNVEFSGVPPTTGYINYTIKNQNLKNE